MPDRNATLRRAVIALMALCLISDASVRATSGASADVPPRSSAAAVNAAIVLGNAWKADNSPLPHARLRLRNVTTGRLAATTVANASGQFSFDNAEPGSYVIELVDEREKVIALGQIFSLGPGETVATFVRLGARAPWFTGFFSNAATTAVTAASSLGVTALGSDGQPVSAAPASGQ